MIPDMACSDTRFLHENVRNRNTEKNADHATIDMIGEQRDR